MTTIDGPHELVGKWRIYEAAKSASYAWALDLPVDALFEITSDHRFVPGDGCGLRFAQAKQLNTPPTRIQLLHEGEHDHEPLGDDETLSLTLDDATVLKFKLYYEEGHKRVWILGPADPFPPGTLAGVLLEHGGPHGEPA